MPHRLQRYLSGRTPEEYRPEAIAHLAALDHLEAYCPEVAAAIIQELQDERSHLKLIASENFSSPAVQLAMGNWFTDKYAEGSPRHRFYAGCGNVDTVEELARDTLIQLFGCDHAYVQPHSGADANLVALWTILLQRIQSPALEKLGKKSLEELSPEEYEGIRQQLVNQKLMGMSLNAGGHLTHGYRHNSSSKMLHAVPYDVDPATERLDYSALARQVLEERPLILLAGYSAHPCRLNFAKMREMADSVGAVLLVDMAHFAGLVAGGVFTGEFNPIPYAHLVTSTTHKTLRGPRGGFVLCTREFSEMVDKGCPAVLGGPLPHVMAAKAVAFREASTPDFRIYAQRVVDNARFLAEALLEKGIRLVTGGTENHLVILDVSRFGITGRQAESALREAHITANRNAIPYDRQGPWYTSGIRLGSAALTTLGMGRDEMREIADLIVALLASTRPKTLQKTGQPSRAQGETPPAVIESARQRVLELLACHPLYPEIEL